MERLPVLTEVVQVPPPAAPALQDLIVQTLPDLVRDALQELQPQLEQQLLDALMPRLMAALAQWPSDATPPPGSGGPRLP
jgi:hypothetical protein